MFRIISRVRQAADPAADPFRTRDVRQAGRGPGGSGHPLAAQPGEDELTVQPGNGTGDRLAAADDGADGGTGADDVHVPGIAI